MLFTSRKGHFWGQKDLKIKFIRPNVRGVMMTIVSTDAIEKPGERAGKSPPLSRSYNIF